MKNITEINAMNRPATKEEIAKIFKDFKEGK
jgi:hypothetical protein